jgi:hypothetical protein
MFTINSTHINETIYWHRKAFFENEDIDAGLVLAVLYKGCQIARF